MTVALDLDTLLRPGTLLLDTARPTAENPQSLLFTDPVDVLTARGLDAVGPLLRGLDEATGAGYHVAGYLGYEAGYAFEDIGPVADHNAPLAWFGVYEVPESLPPQAVDAFWSARGEAPLSVTDVTFSPERDAYLDAIAAIKSHIRAGDVYQINYTGVVTFALDGAPWMLYRALRSQQRVPYGAFLNLGDTQVLSLSPELFFRREGDHVVTRPMKGTIHRGRTLAEDDDLRDWLRHDEKSRAENLMIVDLLRNDLSICCTPGTVRVPALFTTEPYDTVTQMTSTVEGTLRQGVGYANLFQALFPCGSVTGAPKIRAMKLIRELEPGPRGVYCGAIGHIAPDDTAVFNVAIRTAVVREGRGRMGVGSGIVWDSDPGAEFEECRLKARFLDNVANEASAESGDFKLIETMRWEEGRIALWDRHKERLRASAAYFGFRFDAETMRALVDQHTADLAHNAAYKVRLTLDRWGAFEITTERLDAPEPSLRRCVIADVRVDASDPFRYHKTTRRQVYRKAYQQAQHAGADEALLLNERGAVTEGTRTNVFLRQGEKLVTPPLSSGVLNGVYRRHVLATQPAAREQVVHVEDLRTADAIYLCNAVRGWQEVVLLDEDKPVITQG